jgi:hypothetical protein
LCYLSSKNTTGHRNISFIKRDSSFQVVFSLPKEKMENGKKQIVIGRYKTLEEAIVERNKHLQEYYGDYLPTNYV